VWAPATDSISMPSSIDCVVSNPASQQQVVVASTATTQATGVDVPLTYAGGMLTFPVPSQSSYHGELTCYLILSMTAEVTDCSGFAKCAAYPGSGPGTQFATSI
jgi:hypothetical protein